MRWFGRKGGNANTNEAPKTLAQAHEAEAAARAQLQAATRQRQALERREGVGAGVRPSRAPVGVATTRLSSERGGTSERGRGFSERG